jgi:hypothetical protein
MMKDGRAGHSSLTDRPILNELNVIVAEGAERARVSIQARSGQESCFLLGGNLGAFNAELRDPG